MSGETIGFISIGAMILVNIIISSYNYGRLTEKVSGLDKRVGNLERGTVVCSAHSSFDSRLRDVEVRLHK